MDEPTLTPAQIDHEQRMALFSMMFVTAGMTCFIWQTIESGSMLCKSRKPIIGIVFFQALIGVIVTFVTLLASLVKVDCTFLLSFSVVGVNIADMTLQFVLLWKAYLGNNRSKLILGIGSIPILAIGIFIIVNFTVGRSTAMPAENICVFEYPTGIAVAKAVIDCTANTFLSGCFILVIYKHYRILGSSVQKTLITEGLLYCFGVCFSNILTGILVSKTILGGHTPILYTIDWYIASYLIIKQLSHRTTSTKPDDDSLDEEDIMSMTSITHQRTRDDDEEKLTANQTHEKRDTYYSSLDGTLVPTSPRSIKYSANAEEKNTVPDLPSFEGKVFPSPSTTLEDNQKYGISKFSSSLTEVGGMSDDDENVIRYNSNSSQQTTLRKSLTDKNTQSVTHQSRK